MKKSARNRAKPHKLEKRLYVITCWSCKQPIPQEFVSMESDAPLEPLLSKLESEGKITGESVLCPYLLSNGCVCGAGNRKTRDVIEFASDLLSKEEQRVISPSLE
jgi:hypothetical protein